VFSAFFAAIFIRGLSPVGEFSDGQPGFVKVLNRQLYLNHLMNRDKKTFAVFVSFAAILFSVAFSQ
jgi:hypothetical protein